MSSDQKEKTLETPLDIYPKLRIINEQWTHCADCNAVKPKWAEISRGILICLQCSGVHRSLGTHCSKVRSLTLDNWTQQMVDNMVASNATFNALWEYHVDESFMKPTSKTRRDIRTKYIKAKYIGLRDYKQTNRLIPAFHREQFGPKQPRYADSKYDADSIDEKQSTATQRDKDHVGMVAYTGVCKIFVMCAKDLPKADTFSDSDPYVVFENSNGQQAKTKVIDDDNNPQWNEMLVLSVNEVDDVRIRIYDQDKGDDDLLCVGSLNVGKQCKHGQDVMFSMMMTVDKRYKKQNKHPTLKFKCQYDKMDV